MADTCPTCGERYGRGVTSHKPGTCAKHRKRQRDDHDLMVETADETAQRTAKATRGNTLAMVVLGGLLVVGVAVASIFALASSSASTPTPTPTQAQPVQAQPVQAQPVQAQPVQPVGGYPVGDPASMGRYPGGNAGHHRGR